jgi:HNH endonuclease
MNYRKIWIKANGPIPLDENGISYDIHHLDGNRKNNESSNLIAVSLQEHYDIHWKQGDYGACARIAERMKWDRKEINKLIGLSTKNMFSKQDHPWLGGEFQRQHNKKRIEAGTHHLLGGEQQRTVQNKLIKDGTHNFLREDVKKKTNDKLKSTTKELLKNGNHISQRIFTCPHCGKSGKGAVIKRWHFEKCHNAPAPSSDIVEQ